MMYHGGGVYFTTILTIVILYFDNCSAIIYERHIIHVPLYIHVVHHHHRHPKTQKLTKVPAFRPLPPLPAFPQKQHPPLQQNHQQQQNQQQQHHNQQKKQQQQQFSQQYEQQPLNQQIQQQPPYHLNFPNSQQYFNQNPGPLINPRHPQHLIPHLQQQRTLRQQGDAQWIPPAQIQQMLRPNPPQRRPGVGAVKPGTPGQASRPRPGKKKRPPSPYSTLYSHRPGRYSVPSPVKYIAVAKPRPSALSDSWYAYG